MDLSITAAIRMLLGAESHQFLFGLLKWDFCSPMPPSPGCRYTVPSS